LGLELGLARHSIGRRLSTVNVPVRCLTSLSARRLSTALSVCRSALGTSPGPSCPLVNIPGVLGISSGTWNWLGLGLGVGLGIGFGIWIGLGLGFGCGLGLGLGLRLGLGLGLGVG